MAYDIVHPKVLQHKSRTHEVTQIGAYRYEVTSGHSGETYTVELTDGGATCSCSWGAYRPYADRRSGCSHVLSVYDTIDAGRSISAWVDVRDAARQHRPMTYVGNGVTVTSRRVNGGPTRTVAELRSILHGEAVEI